MNSIWQLDTSEEEAKRQFDLVHDAMRNLKITDARDTTTVLNLLEEAFYLDIKDLQERLGNETPENIARTVAKMRRNNIERDFMVYYRVFRMFSVQK